MTKKGEHYCEEHKLWHEDILCDRCVSELMGEGRKDRATVSKRLKKTRATAKAKKKRVR